MVGFLAYSSSAVAVPIGLTTLLEGFQKLVEHAFATIQSHMSAATDMSTAWTYPKTCPKRPVFWTYHFPVRAGDLNSFGFGKRRSSAPFSSASPLFAAIAFLSTA